ncbi:SMP-30/gluconolactonase/LRE family protein [Paenibacillus eucommiae]|uniref:Regucalcin n=1 Tax=Paenibacillus eucommiae TaxID=1355755 RepID=A0ABS4J0S8_9BACL|nr:SMP-30/gluconolactonase/LRE family protein [Paenibacillus eucommiae]MBP1993437.1 sugar lactone lactonase YvrE [Paenibacillus eucommiae]
MNTATLVLDAKAALGEGPSWDAERKLLYWVDITRESFHAFNPVTGTDEVFQVGQQVGAVVPRRSGGVILAMQQGFYAYDFTSGALTPLGDPEEHLPNNRFNDGKCDAAGRFWAGTMRMNEHGSDGTLYCLEPDLTIRPVLSGLAVSNGIAWSSDNRKMYFIDSLTRVVMEYEFDLESGTLSNGRAAVQLEEGPSLPDGMTIDEEGMLWVAEWDGYRVGRWNPNTGELLQSVEVPSARVTSCVFAGENMDNIYITTSRKDLSDEELRLQPLAGGLFHYKAQVRGAATYSFGG